MSKRILIAENEPTAREVLTKFATNRGYDVTAVSNGVDLLRVATAEKFDVVITDLKMEGLDGASAAKIMKLQGDITPVIAITGVSEHDIHRIQDAFTKIFHKPIIASKLLNYIETLLESRVSFL
jgi:CheY-like chemotaxis protein